MLFQNVVTYRNTIYLDVRRLPVPWFLSTYLHQKQHLVCGSREALPAHDP